MAELFVTKPRLVAARFLAFCYHWGLLMKDEILLVEDDSVLARSLERVLKLAGYNVTIAPGAESALEHAARVRWASVVTDFKLPHLSGLELVDRLRTVNARLPIILMTAHGTADLAIEAIKRGAYDYLVKPFEMSTLLATIENAVRHSRLAIDPCKYHEQENIPANLAGNSPAMQTVYKDIGRVAATPTAVLIRGESGTGKELVARAIWRHSNRAAKPFVAINCTAIPETLIETEMFGHERGAFTGADARRIGRFEQADGGTIFLDEIGDMTLSTQVKLLRVLQEKSIQRVGGREPISVDIRVIAATHRNLAEAIRERRFREDLFYRLNVVCITVPPLRERTEDIPQLVNCFLHRHSIEMGIVKPTMQNEAMDFLRAQSWPGNVRELESAVRRALLVTPGFPITLGDVQRAMVPSALEIDPPLAALAKESLTRAARGEPVKVYAELLGSFERELFAQAIKLARGNQVRAARWLGISRFTLRARLQKFGLTNRIRSE
jgi:two-component system, NtrC family, response regulator